MSKLLEDLDRQSEHWNGRPFDREQVRRDFRLYGHKKRSETLDVVRARLDNEEVSSIRNYAAAARLYTDLLDEHKRLTKAGLE